MFARRRKEDGFEWHKYVRTTIKLRREQRRQRVLDARQAAAGQIGAAGKALAAGSRAAGGAALEGARAGLWASGLMAQGVWHALLVGGRVAAGKLAVLAQPLLGALARPNIGGPIALAGAIAFGSGIGRMRGTGLDGEAALTLGIGLALLAAASPSLSATTGLRWPASLRLALSPRRAAMALGVVAIVAGAAWLARGGSPHFPGIASRLALIGSANVIKGRAEAVGGDRLRVAARTLYLAGIEAPERQQRCGAGGRGWRCGAAAEAALGRLVNGRHLECTLSGGEGASSQRATCLSGNTDIGAELVKQGHVFAEIGLFSSYAGLERDARNAKLGIWSSGDVERPAAYRARTGKKSGGGRSAQGNPRES
jgi:endonuclease YncB( thermonuclease family)